jgi:hypothetical protein
MDFKTFDVNDVVLGAPKPLKFITVWNISTKSGKPLIFCTPKFRLSTGIFAVDFSDSKISTSTRVDDLATATKVTLPMSIDFPCIDKDTNDFILFFHELDRKVIDLFRINGPQWFKSDCDFITRNMDKFYNSPIKPAGQYPALFTPKIMYEKEKFKTVFYDENGTFIPDPIRFVEQNTLGKCMFELQGFSQQASSNKIYPIMRALQVKVFPNEQDSSVGYAGKCAI